MTIKKVEIKDNDDATLYPRTSTDQVFDDSGKSLEVTITELEYAVKQTTAGSSYGIVMNGNDEDQIMTASTANEILKIDGEGLSSVELVPKTPGQAGSRDTVKITSRFPTWDELTGDPLTVFNNKDFIFDNDVIGINPAKVGNGGGGGGGLPYVNVKSFTVIDKDPVTGEPIPTTYAAKGDNSSPKFDTDAIERAFQIARDEGSVNIYIPDGTYLLTRTIQVYRNTNVQASRNAVIKKTHSGVMFANTAHDEAYIGYEGGKQILKPTDKPASNNGNIFFDGGIWDNNKTSGSTFSFINARNFEFKNLTVRDILDSHAFDLCGIADMIIYNCNFLGFNYRGSKTWPDPKITDWTTQIKAYSECIQIDYSSKEGYPAQDTGQDGTCCKRIRVDKCYFGKSENFPAWNRVFGGHNTYVPTYDWLYNPNGTPTGNLYNFIDSKPTDLYFINNVVEGNGTLKYDYDENDSQSYIIQQVRLQCVDNVIVMNNKFRNVKGGISIDLDQTPKTMNPADDYKNFLLSSKSGALPQSGVMPAKVTYLDSKGDMQEIIYSSDSADQDLNKITTHVHNGITYTVIWCKSTKFVDYYGWKNAMIMGNEITNVTCGIYDYKQVTSTINKATTTNQIIINDVYDTLGTTQLINPGTEIYITDPTITGNDPNPKVVRSVVGTYAGKDMNGNDMYTSPYTITFNPALSSITNVGTPVFIKNTPSKNASTPIYLRGSSTPYNTATKKVSSTGAVSFTYTTGSVQDPRGKNAIVYGNIIDGTDQIKVFSQYEDVILNGRKIAKIDSFPGAINDQTTNTSIFTINKADPYFKSGENIYFAISSTDPADLSNPYQIMEVKNVGTTSKPSLTQLTIYPMLPDNATASWYVWSRKPILAGETGGASVISAISSSYVWDLLIQDNVFKNVPRAIYTSGNTRINILGNHFFEIQEVEAVCINNGKYCNVIGNIFSDINDHAIEMRGNNYFNIANNELLNTNSGPIYQSPVPNQVNFLYDPLDNPTVIVMGISDPDPSKAKGQYGTITGNMFVHNNSRSVDINNKPIITPIKTGILADDQTTFIKMSNNSFPSPFTKQQDNKSDVGLDYGYHGNDADTLQGYSIGTLTDKFISTTIIGAPNGVASLDKDGKIIDKQLPDSLGGAGFKTITLPNGDSLNATTKANILTLQATGGIILSKDVNNTLLIRYDTTQVDKIPNILLDIKDLQDNQTLDEGVLASLQTAVSIKADKTYLDNNLNLYDERIDALEIAMPNKIDKDYVDDNFIKHNSDVTQIFTSDLSFNGNSDFIGNTTFEDTANFNKDVVFDNITSPESIVDFKIPTKFEKVVDFNDSINVNEISTFNDSITFNNNQRNDASVNFNPVVTFNNTIDVSKKITMQNAEFNKIVTFKDGVTFDNTNNPNTTVDFNRKTNFDAQADFNQQLNANSKVTFKDGVTFDNTNNPNTTVDFNRETNFTQPVTFTNTVEHIADVQFTRYEEKIGSFTTIDNGPTNPVTVLLDISSGNIFRLNVSSNMNVSYYSPVPFYTANYVQGIVVYLEMQATTHMVSFNNVKWHNDTMPTLQANKHHEIILRTKDGGNTWMASSGGIF